MGGYPAENEEAVTGSGNISFPVIYGSGAVQYTFGCVS